MPVMKQEKIRLHGKVYIRKVKWERRRECFTIEYPHYISEAIDETTASGDTIKEAKDAWDKGIKDFNKATTSKRKIICYNYEGDETLEKGNAQRKADNIFGEEPPTEMNYQVSVKICFWVGYELQLGDEKKYVDIHGENKWVQSYNGEDIIIPWTKERESFFRKLTAQLARTSRRAKRFFTQKRKTLLGMIDTKSKLLGFSGA